MAGDVSVLLNDFRGRRSREESEVEGATNQAVLDHAFPKNNVHPGR